MLMGAVYEPRWLGALLRSVHPDVARRTVLAGQQPPGVVAAAYAAAEVFAFPSQTDTQALVLQEAALAGRPSVLADPLLHRHGPLGGRACWPGPTRAISATRSSTCWTTRLRPPRSGKPARPGPGGTPRATTRDAVCEVYRFAQARTGRFNTRGRTRR